MFRIEWRSGLVGQIALFIVAAFLNSLTSGPGSLEAPAFYSLVFVGEAHEEGLSKAPPDSSSGVLPDQVKNCTKVRRNVKLLDDVPRLRKMRSSEGVYKKETAGSSREGEVSV